MSYKCPKCGDKNVYTERRMNGNSDCEKCNFSGPSKMFLDIHDSTDFKSITITEPEFDEMFRNYGLEVKLEDVKRKLFKRINDD